jgi:hypothetical protein
MTVVAVCFSKSRENLVQIVARGASATILAPKTWRQRCSELRSMSGELIDFVSDSVFCQEFLVVSLASREINLIRQIALCHDESLIDVNSEICPCFLLTAKSK